MSKTKLDRTAAAQVLASCMEGNTYSPKAIASNIKWIGQTGPKLDATIHASAIACIAVSLPHNEGGHSCFHSAVALVQTLKDLNKSARTKALIAWFHAHSNLRLRIEKDGKVTGGILPQKSKLFRAGIDPMAAWDKPFWVVEEKDTDPREFSIGLALANLLKRAEKAIAEMSDEEKAALADLKATFDKLAPADATPAKETADA